MLIMENVHPVATMGREATEAVNDYYRYIIDKIKYVSECKSVKFLFLRVT